MNKTILFKGFCFLAAFLLLNNIITDAMAEQIPYFNMLMQFGLAVLLLDFGFHAKEQAKNSDIEDSESSNTYAFLASKIGISTALIGFLIQSFSI